MIFNSEPTLLEVAGQDVPIWCGISTLEKIQEEILSTMSETDFENALRGFEPNRDEKGEIIVDENGKMTGRWKVMPDIKLVRKVLTWMIEEGLDITGDTDTDPEEVIKHIQINPLQLGQLVHAEYVKCFVTISKNVRTARKEKKTK